MLGLIRRNASITTLPITNAENIQILTYGILLIYIPFAHFQTFTTKICTYKNKLIQQTYWMICLTTSSADLHDKLTVTQLSLNAKGPFTLILTIVYYIQDDSVFNLYLSSCIKEENSANWFPSSGARAARHLLIWGPIYTAILNQ
jgi:hypothetical protein